MLVNRTVITAKIESVYNTDPVPTGAANAILVEKPSWSNEGARMVERPAVRSTLASLKPIYAGSLVGIKFSCELKGSGAAGTAPEIGVLLRACAMGETVVASTSVTYKPVSSSIESCTIYFYDDGTLWKATGCRGNASFSLDTGGKGMVDFSFTGHVSGPTDVALATPTYNATIPPPIIGASFSVDSYSAVIAKLAFDLGNTLAKPANMSASDGYAALQITKRDIKGSFDPEHSLVATYNWLSKWRASSSGALATGTIGSTAGNRYAVSMPAVFYRDIAPGDREGVRTLAVGFGAAESTTDDEVSIAFT